MRNKTQNNELEDQSFLTQISDVQTNLISQMQEMSGVFPDTPLSASFRVRMRNTIYLLLGSILFGIFAIFIGIPTLTVRPSKFALCLTISTLLAIASIVVLQTPTTFVENLWASGWKKGTPFGCLCISSLVSIYLTVFVHKYLLTMLIAGVQVACIFWFFSSFIPGGRKGMWLLLRASISLSRALLTPLISLCSMMMREGLSWII